MRAFSGLLVIACVGLAGCRGRAADGTASPSATGVGPPTTGAATAAASAPGTATPAATRDTRPVTAAPASTLGTPPVTAESPTSAATEVGAASLPAGATGVGTPVSGGTLGGTYQLTDLRAGRQADGRVRLVWEMAEATGAPLYEAESLASAAGTGHVVVTLHDVNGMALGDLLPVSLPSGIVTDVHVLAVPDDAMLRFEVGVAVPAPFVAQLLENPVRLVVDVLDPRP
jgi:hypothetical protein